MGAGQVSWGKRRILYHAALNEVAHAVISPCQKNGWWSPCVSKLIALHQELRVHIGTHEVDLRPNSREAHRLGVSTTMPDCASQRRPKPPLLFRDDFDDGDITDWTISGTWGLSGGTLNKTTSTGGGIVGYTGATFADFQAGFRAIITSTLNSNWVALQFRKDEPDDLHWQSGYMVYYRGNGGLDLYEAGAGVIASTATGKTLDVWREVVVRAEGSQISVWVDGELELVHTDGTFTGGYLGFRAHHVLASFDDLTVESVEGRYYIRSASGQVLAEYDVAGDVVTVV